MKLLKLISREGAVAAALAFAIVTVFAASASAELAELPSGYTRLNFIESHGGEYIDTGYKPSATTKIAVEYSFARALTTGISHYVFGCYSSGGVGGRCQFALKNNEQAFLGFGDITSYVSNHPNVKVSALVRQTAVMDRGTFTLSACPTAKTYPTPTSVFNASLYLFANHGGDTVQDSTYSDGLRIYGLKAWTGSELVLDLVPAKDGSGKVGFVNLAAATPTFLTAGVGTLTGSGDEPVVEQIDSTTAEEMGGATGGDQIFRVDNGDNTYDLIHVFGTVGTASLAVSSTQKIIANSLDFLIVGGGGSGGSDSGGGGGGGGVVEVDSMPIDIGSMTVVVGAGGDAVQYGKNLTRVPGKAGNGSSLTLSGTTYTAFGGGAGGCWQNQAATDGGSGGGANGKGYAGKATQVTPGIGGHDGGAGTGEDSSGSGAGGGGAGSAGVAATTTKSGNGGDGILSMIGGEGVYFAAGGGGGSSSASISRSTGGSGVGGNGGYNDGATHDSVFGLNGTGSGGGGAYGSSDNVRNGARGGDGIVVIRYTVASEPPAVTYVNATSTTVDGEQLLIFNKGAGSFTLAGAGQIRILAVGGGGAGGSGYGGEYYHGAGGGGGAGGFKEIPSKVYSSGTYNVVVGAGGLAGDGGALAPGGDGGATSVTHGGETIVEVAGGGGGGAETVGHDGASGGGGSMTYLTNKKGTANAGGVGISGQGYAGGAGSTKQLGGGGGGANGAGAAAAAIGAAGGDGLSSDITGSTVYYAAGGGGGAFASANVGLGGNGGGGDGGTSALAATAGENGKGAGGGGAGVSGVGGNGGDGVVIVRISAVLAGDPVKPTENAYEWNGTQRVVMPEVPFAYTITGTAKAADVGNYHFKVVLNPGFNWSDGTTDNFEFDWKIVQAENAVTDLELQSWQVGMMPSTPTAKARFGTIVYEYSTAEGGPWSSERPTEAGSYWVRASVAETAGYKGAEQKVEFSIVSGPAELFNDHARIDIAGVGSELTDFPVLIKLSEAALRGFSYSRLSSPSDGADIRFTSESGDYLPHEIDTWVRGGESLIWVKIPTLPADGTSIIMYWGNKSGLTENDPTQVWSAYSGVWHMNEVINSSTASTTLSKDSTAGAHHAVPTKGTSGSANLTQMISSDGAIGRSRVNSSATASVQQGNRLVTTKYTLNGRFTFSGWYYATQASQYPRFGGNKNGTDGAGWTAETVQNSTTSIMVRGDGTSSLNSIPIDNMKNNWVYLTFVYDGKNVSVYSNGKLAKSGTVNAISDTSNPLAIGADSNGSQYSFVGKYDEIRLAPFARSADWIAAEYGMMSTNNTLVSFGPVTLDGETQNYWIREPSISLDQWDFGTEAGVIDQGEAAIGTVKMTLLNAVTGEELDAMPTAVGVYEAIVSVAPGAGEEFTTLEMILPFRIMEHSPYTGLSSADGRVMLANNDDNLLSPVTYQAYYQQTASYSTFWVHTGEVAESAHLLAAENHAFYTANYARKLWWMQDVRIGNTYPASDTADLLANQAYLPNSYPIVKNSKSSIKKPTRAEVSHMVLRNSLDAAIYSGCYDDGIGTIYFDAVNGWVVADAAGASEYQIQVEIATNCINSVGNIVMGEDGLPLPPTDENVHEIMPAHYEPEYNDDGVIVGSNFVAAATNEYGRANWQPLSLSVLKRDYPADWTDEMPFVPVDYTLGATNEFQNTDGKCTNVCLAVANGGGTNNFYRIYIPINCHGAARFRILRTSYHPGARTPDMTALILLDNLIVSYPQMRVDMSAFGWFDPEKGGKDTLGQELAWNVPFPSVKDELYARAVPDYYVNAGKADADTNSFVAAANMYYRWRYLDQKTSEWKKVALNPANGFTANRPLELPGLVGDVEYYFESQLNAPFYEYVDYSGTGLKLGGFYTEELSKVVNRAPTDRARQASQGTDWYVRLREGKSDYETIRLVARYLDNDGLEMAEPVTVSMELIGDHIWRGYLQTKSSMAGQLRYRFEALNRQEPGATEWAESVAWWHSRDDITSLPASVMVVDGAEGDWSALPNDASTGYLLFQLDDSTRSLTIVHADYQNFNGWNDANVGGSLFVGSSTEDEGKVGVSAQAVECRENFNDWLDMPATNEHWSESFTTTVTQEYGDYTTFQNTRTPNGWSAGQGMWVYGNYKDSTTGRALQMQGQGIGYLEFVDPALSPRGLESISFNARLGQFIDLTDFSFYDAPVKSALTDYTFAARVAFDANGSKSFSGAASVSLVARYMERDGCYEARLEQIGASFNQKTHEVIGPRNSKVYDVNGTSRDLPRQALSLYRWYRDPDTGRKTVTLLHSVTNTSEFSMAYPTSRTAGHQPMYICVSNMADGAVWISAGLSRGYAMTSSDTDDRYSTSKNSKKWFNLCYVDGSKERRLYGTYGALVANCEGEIVRPTVFNGVIPMSVYGYTDKTKMTSVGNSSYKDKGVKDKSIEFPTSVKDCYDEINGGFWVKEHGRTATFLDNRTLYGLYGMAPTQKLNIYTSPAGKTEWTLLASTNFSSFGTTATKCVFPLYTTKDCSVKIAAAGTLEDVRTDLVIDDVELRQWRGNDWDDVDEMVQLIPGWNSEVDIKGHTNFIFTSSWIVDKSILLSAKRTASGTPCGIRSPLFDGRYNRGLGLGMFSFSYKDAQENVNLLLQVATNVNYEIVNNINNLDENTWVTVTNFSFKGVSSLDRREGTRSCYIGMHGVEGVMRLIMDPAVVDASVNQKDKAKFGDIYITEVFCRDEPILDASSWWGWNLRTFGPDALGKDGEKRMYLPDLSPRLGDLGLSLALNNSVTEGVDASDGQTYKQHLPFLQTPTFASNIVGEVTFRARKYDSLETSQPAQVTLYGSLTGDEFSEWTRLAYFMVSNTSYTTYSFKTEPGHSYGAFRLAVTGVPGVTDTTMQNRSPEGYDNPVRVLIDEVLVSEAVRARVAFRKAGAFRSDMDTTGYVPDVPSEKQQPLCKESWGVECEIYAAQLPDEIDFTRTPRVKLYWFEGDTPWGFDMWKDDPHAKSAYLARASGTNLVYRSSYVTAPDAVVSPSITPGTTVQYMLEVTYYQVGASTPMTNYLSYADWTNPEWYHPVDKNREAANGRFSAYTILDTVAPHWSWINEINVFSEYDYNYDNGDKDLQFVEIAVPAEADITGWSVRMLQAQNGNDTVITNTIGIFGNNSLEPTKPGLIGMASNMVFRVLANKAARDSQNLKFADGTLDAVWKFDYPTTVYSADGEISAIDPIAVQLVRGSGIIEHEVVSMGTNWWSDLPFYDMQYNPSNTVNYLNSHLPGSRFIYVGDDDGGITRSRGVFDARGETTNVWNNTMNMTPGRINEGQNIDPDHPTPNGSSIIVYCNLDYDVGHIYQTVGDAVMTNGSQMVFIQKGSQKGTNITYRVDPWYQLGTVTANGRPVAATPLAEPRTWTVNVGANCSNNVTVVAGAVVKDELVNLGVDDSNKYKPAIMDWLSKRQDAFGNDWADSETDSVKLADILALDGSFVTNMTITQMYWLDMDPTVGNLALKAGMAEAPMPRAVEFGGDSFTNLRMGVFMMITNRVEDVSDPHYAEAWTPYVTRALDPGVTSWDYADPACEWGWTSATFKVTGLLMNGLTSEDNPRNWLPLRWFVFQPDSFYQPGESDAFISRIEILDPYGKSTPGYSSGWYDWVQEHGYTPIFFSWSLDTRLMPFTVEQLKKENYYQYE